MNPNRCFKIIFRNLNYSKKINTLYDIQPVSKIKYNKVDLYLNDKKIIISIPENVSKELLTHLRLKEKK